MKCDNCKNKKFHSAGSWWSVAEGGDDPYNYEYCSKNHWVSDSSIPQSEESVGMEDQFADCIDFEISKLN